MRNSVSTAISLNKDKAKLKKVKANPIISYDDHKSYCNCYYCRTDQDQD
jgi:hypothetical protein